MGTTSRIARVGALWCILSFASVGLGGVHLWTFDEGQGDSLHDLADAASGSVHGARWVAGKVGGALAFDGIDDYAALPDNEPVWLPVQDFTIAFWVWFERDLAALASANEVLVDLNCGASADPANELGYNVQRRGDTGEICFQIKTERDTDEDLYSVTVPAPGRWVHVTVVRQGTLQSLYLDGVLDACRACSSSPVKFVGGYDDDKVNIGRYTTTSFPPRAHFQGKLDELMLFDRALSSAEVRRLYEDSTATNCLYVDGLLGRDSNDGKRPLTAFATIQAAIDAARNGETVLIGPGVYTETLNPLGKAITIQSRGDAAVLQAPDEFAVSFYHGEGPGTVLSNLIIANSFVGIFCAHSSPTITNVTVVGNVYGAEAYGRALPRISNSIFWDNADSDLYGCSAAYSCIERGGDGEHNFTADPLFVDPEHGDYHVRSERGRYWPEHGVWVLDEVTSPCVDAGDPAADFSGERTPNGGRLNVGAHGGTAYAEMSEPPAPAEAPAGGRTVRPGR